jgi:uncharacterized protein
MRGLLAELGLTQFPPVHRDPWFIAAVLAALALWLSLALITPPGRLARPTLAIIVSLTLWQPLVEEFVFRGVLQPRLAETAFGAKRWLGLSGANLIASFAFSALHVIHHPPLWAAATFIPSLVFGFFRDRHRNLYPPLLLHIYYNSGYFLTVGFPS